MKINIKLVLTILFTFFLINISTQAQELWGMTWAWGENSSGIIFKYNPISTIQTKMFDFNGPETGRSPYGSLVKASDGNLYGMTVLGGSSDIGVLFSFDPVNSVHKVKVNFNGANGGIPEGSLVEASNNKLYGLTRGGGANFDGVLFEYDMMNNIFDVKIDFDRSNSGAGPRGNLLYASNGKLYGLTNFGGANNQGTLFDYDPVSGEFNKKFDFGGANGEKPRGELMQASNGKLYGMTFEGGTNDDGILFEYNIETDTFLKKLDFNRQNTGGFLLEV